MDGYGQFCPVAMASELLTRKWTPLIVRELLLGSVRFNDLRRGLPEISPSLLSTRLKELADHGVVERRSVDGHPEYHLTPAGEELRDVIEPMGVWGKRWARAAVEERDLDAGLLMWDLQRRIERDELPDRQVVVEFRFEDGPEEKRLYWLVLAPGEVDLCFEDRGFTPDLRVTTRVGTLTGVWMGDVRFSEALRRGKIRVRGPTELRRAFPGWLGLSLFAGVERKRRAEASAAARA